MAQNASRFSHEFASKADAPSHARKIKRPVVTNARANAQRTKRDLEREAREQAAFEQQKR